MNNVDLLKQYIASYYIKTGKKPTLNWLSKKMDLPVEEIKRLLEEMKKKPRKQDKIIIDFIRIVMFIVGFGASIMSVYYTFIWLKDFLPVILAFLLSFIMIIFSVFVFETVIILVKQKRFYGWFLLFPWIVVLIFSMTSTIAGQYNNRIKNFNKKVINQQEVYKISEKRRLLIEEKNNLEGILKDKKEERKVYQNILKQFDTLEKRKADWKYYWNTYHQLESVDKKIDEVNKRINEINKELGELLENKNLVYSEQKERNFYSWLGKVIKADENLIEFWLSLFPALFIDIIAPLAFAISLFLRKTEK